MISKILYLTIVLVLSIPRAKAQINWQNGQPSGTIWASACDFTNSDLSNAPAASNNCASACQSTPGCTHFSWTTNNGGTCWMKKNSVSKSDAVYNGNTGMICGIVPGGI